MSVHLSERTSVTKAESSVVVTTGTPTPSSETPSPVLLCTFHGAVTQGHMTYSADAIYGLFSKYGVCQKIVRFVKQGVTKALIQFSSAQEANTAKTALNNQFLMDGVQLRILFSPLASVEVKAETESSKDFTMHGVNTSARGLVVVDNAGGQTTFSAAAAAGMVMPVMQPQMNHYYPYSQLPMPHQFPHTFHVPQQRHPVLLVNGLAETVKPNTLFTLFGVYGDVLRVKILFQKRDSALIQYSNEQQAQLALSYLEGIELYGSRLRVQMSNKPEIKIPRTALEDEQNLTKDFTNSPLHRFRNVHSKNFQNIAPPSPVLHVSNLPLEFQEQDVRTLFTGRTVKHVKFITPEGKPRQMALVTFPTIGDAVDILTTTDGHKLSPDTTMRVSFAKIRTNNTTNNTMPLQQVPAHHQQAAGGAQHQRHHHAFSGLMALGMGQYQVQHQHQHHGLPM